jgi:hypothetical protein
VFMDVSTGVGIGMPFPISKTSVHEIGLCNSRGVCVSMLDVFVCNTKMLNLIVRV